MSQAWKTYCVLLLCISTLKMLAADNTSQEEKDEKHAKKIGEKVTKAMETVLSEADADEDGKVSLDELTAWTQDTLRLAHKRETKQRLANLDTNKDGKVSWEEFQKSKEDIGAATEELKRKRFSHADGNKDDMLSENELNSMFHAEEKPHMHDVIYEEYMEIGDIDKDGRLSLKEYKTKMFKGSKENEKAADMFFSQQDKNKDGHLDREEIKLWLKSINTASKAKKQAQHYFETADENKDGFLSPDEIKKNTDLFFSGAKLKREAKKEDDNKTPPGRCPHAHRVGKKAKQAKEAKESKEPKEAKEPNDEKKSKDNKDVKDEL